MLWTNEGEQGNPPHVFFLAPKRIEVCENLVETALFTPLRQGGVVEGNESGEVCDSILSKLDEGQIERPEEAAGN